MLPEGTPGKYTVWAVRDGKKEANQSCATLAEVQALKAEWEAAGYAVKVVEANGQETETPGAR
jgi:hypothetical protein